MKILVTGAGGDIGSQLVPSFIKQGHKVRALVKTPEEANRIRQPGLEIFMADITDPATLSGAALNIDVAYHLAAALFVTRPEETLREINYGGTINIANECIDKGVKRFVFPSTPLVLGPHTRPEKPLSPEDAIIEPTSYHALYKKLAEQHLLVLSKHEQLPVTILRLGTVYGPDIRFIKTLKTFMKRGLYRIPGKGDYIMSTVHIDDVIQGMNLVLENEEAAGQIYNIADDRPVEFKEFVFELADLLDVPRPGFAPMWLYRMFASLDTLWAEITKTAPLITNDVLTFSTSSFAADNNKAKEQLGFRPKYPTIYEGLPTCVKPPSIQKRQAAA
ncbi:MAG: NAD-dependent epimerase/dehydratase family protein [Firmicutes bacterium]|nr:NAD-dependent epimerase/dehydratase family protein [Bacillota bacterium]